MGQEPRHSLAGSSSWIRVPAWMVVSSTGLTEASSVSRLTQILVGRVQFLVGWWPESLMSLLALGWRPSSVPRHGGLSNVATQLIKIQQEVESAGKTEVIVVCRLITEAMSHHCLHLLLVRTKLQSPATLMGRGSCKM